MTASTYAPLNDREWLYQRYFVDRWTQVQIAKHVNCGRETVARALERFGWDTERRNPSRIDFDEEELRRDIQTMSVRAIAQKKGCSTPVVRNALHRFNIPFTDKPPDLRGVTLGRPRKAELTREYLVDRYEKKKWAASRIAKEAGCTVDIVYRRLGEYGIPRRKRTSKLTGVPVEEIYRLYWTEMRSAKEVGEQFRVTAGAILERLKGAGYPTRGTKEALKARFPEGRTGSLAANWKGGVQAYDYIWVHREVVKQRWPNHPRLAVPDWSRCQEHILVWENENGRLLPPGWEIDHLDQNKHNNDPANLRARESRSAHLAAHWERGRKADVESTHLQQELMDLRQEYAQLRSILEERDPDDTPK